jgi:hypothetical protein
MLDEFSEEAPKEPSSLERLFSSKDELSSTEEMLLAASLPVFTYT